MANNSCPIRRSVAGSSPSSSSSSSYKGEGTFHHQQDPRAGSRPSECTLADAEDRSLLSCYAQMTQLADKIRGPNRISEEKKSPDSG